ncbi:MAG: BON domain-containing protein [Candidatus Omnitrophota bacterium]
METIKRNIENILCWDKRLEGSKIRVEVANGRVVLTGIVLNYQAWESARNDALIIPDVVSVESRLKIRKRAHFKSPPDQVIQEKVRKLFSINTDVRNKDVTIHVSNGNVTLRGNVGSYWEKMLASRIAYQVIGVTRVFNQLSVSITEKKQSELVFN